MVVLGEQVRSLAQGLQQTLDQLMEGQLQNTKYVVIIVVLGQETQSCVVVTGEDRGDQCPCGGVVNTVVPWCSVLLQVNVSVVPWQRACSHPVRA